MEDIVIFEWTYSPPDFFEKRVHLSVDHCELAIDAGKVEARIEPQHVGDVREMRDRLRGWLQNIFRAVQSSSRREFDLSDGLMRQMHADGHQDMAIARVDTVMFADTVRYAYTGHAVDFREFDPGGNVIRDSRRDRIQKQKTLAELALKHAADPGVMSMLKSSSEAVADPANEFVHLYEIVEALRKHFHGKKAPCKPLRIDESRWDWFHALCCETPARQSRHRGGWDLYQLRDATPTELAEARAFAAEMIEKYLRHLG